MPWTNLTRQIRIVRICLSPTCGMRLCFRTEPAFALGGVDPCCIVVRLAWHMVDTLPAHGDIAFDAACLGWMLRVRGTSDERTDLRKKRYVAVHYERQPNYGN